MEAEARILLGEKTDKDRDIFICDFCCFVLITVA